MALTFQLKDFDGPLDLLLFLINKEKIDIKDIFVDGILKIGGRDYEALGNMLEKLSALTGEETTFEISFKLESWDEVYEQENARTPKVGALVETPEGRGTVTERNTLKGTVKVAIESQEEAPPKLFSRDEVRFIGKGTSENDVENDSADEIKDEE